MDIVFYDQLMRVVSEFSRKTHGNKFIALPREGEEVVLNEVFYKVTRVIHNYDVNIICIVVT